MQVPLNAIPRTVLVLGGSGVIGRGICLRFAQENWEIGVHYHSHELQAHETATLIQEQEGTAITLQADFCKTEQVNGMLEKVMNAWDRLDVVVCATGQAIDGFTMRFPRADWAALVETNLTGTFRLFKALAPILQTQGHGSVIVVNSLSSTLGTTGQSAYSACKAGLLGLVKTTAREWGASNIRVNAVFPGWHHSPLSGEAFPCPSDLADHVLGRTPALDEVADLVYHLALAKDISGQIFNLDSRIW